MLAQLAEHRVQEPSLWCLACLRIYLGEECIRFLVGWPLDTFCPKSFFVDMALTIMMAAFMQQLPSCGASSSREMLYWFNLRNIARWALSSLSHRCGNWGSESVRRSYSQGTREPVGSCGLCDFLSSLCYWCDCWCVACGPDQIWFGPFSKKKKEPLRFYLIISFLRD